jgi:hypothetical protein
VKLHANHVSLDESGGEYFQVSFDSEAPSEDGDALDLSAPAQPYLLIQRQFEDDDGGVCYIETHDHDTYSGHYRLRLIEFTPTHLAFEIARPQTHRSDLQAGREAVPSGAANRADYFWCARLRRRR